ncbi:MAG: hypothetical protein WDA65_02835 [Christensenellales bacterium]
MRFTRLCATAYECANPTIAAALCSLCAVTLDYIGLDLVVCAI